MINNTKQKQYIIIAVLLVISIALVGMIYTSVNRKNHIASEQETKNNENIPVVEALEDSGKDENFNGNKNAFKDEDQEDNTVTVDPIDVNAKAGSTPEVAENEVIEVPMAVAPEKPNLAPPDHKPETTADLTNPDQQPEYDDDQTTYIQETKPVEIKPEVPSGTYTVPDAENPFLQKDIPSNGVGGEQQGSDFYQDGNPAGEGDKF